MRQPVSRHPALSDLRQQIDRANREILLLLQRRAALVLEIAGLKQELELDAHDPSREEEMLANLTAETAGPFNAEEVESIFRAIFRASLGLQMREREAALVAVPDRHTA